MSPDAPVRLGIVGAGTIAQSYCEILSTFDQALTVAVADVDLPAAERMARRLGCDALADYRALAEMDGLDAVVVCTPPNAHPAIARRFLERGVAVLCEKPLAIDSLSALTMVESAERHGALLTMATKFRYVDDVCQARAMVDAGAIGDLLLLENTFVATIDMSGRWNSDPKVSGGGVLIDNGTHSVDILRFFLGPLTEVLAVEGRRSAGLGVEEEARVFARSAAGATAQVHLSWRTAPSSDDYIVLRGTSGEIHVGWHTSWLERSGQSQTTPFGSGYRKLDAMRGQLRHFCAGVVDEMARTVSMSEALASVDAIGSAYTSLGTGHWTVVPAPLYDLQIPADPTAHVA
jgi:predicted dehydrogenase